MSKSPSETLTPNETLTDLCSMYAPVEKWFPGSQNIGIATEIYRVYKLPFANRPVYPSTLQIIDFDAAKIRAVFVRTSFLFPDFESSRILVPTSDGDTELKPQRSYFMIQGKDDMAVSEREVWTDTEEGVFLLLITPSKTETESRTVGTYLPQSVETTFALARTAIILSMGFNAAFQRIHRAEIVSTKAQTMLAGVSQLRDDPNVYEIPEINGFTAQRAEEIISKAQNCDEEIRNRVALAARWYAKAKRTPVPEGELRSDTFIYYWIAFEALAMPNENADSALGKLSAIHGKPEGEIKKLFPIGRLHGLRSRLVHRGEVYPLDHALNTFMDDLCCDTMLHLLGLDAPKPYTAKYLDGSANSLIPEMLRNFVLPEE